MEELTVTGGMKEKKGLLLKSQRRVKRQLWSIKSQDRWKQNEPDKTSEEKSSYEGKMTRYRCSFHNPGTK